MMIFLMRGISVPKGTRRCSDHLYKGHLSYEAVQSVQRSQLDDVFLDTHGVKKLIIDFRSAVNHLHSFDFDNPANLNNDA